MTFDATPQNLEPPTMPPSDAPSPCEAPACTWIEGDLRAGGYVCTRPALHRKAYCAEHDGVVHVAPDAAQMKWIAKLITYGGRVHMHAGSPLPNPGERRGMQASDMSPETGRASRSTVRGRG